MNTQIFYEFAFDAAHRFEHLPEGAAYPPGHKYRGLHGHSFRVEVALSGRPDVRTGFVVDFGELEQACAALRDALDHTYLNEVGGLSQPSLEHIAAWVWDRLAPPIRRPRSRHGTTRLMPAGLQLLRAGPVSEGRTGARVTG